MADAAGGGNGLGSVSDGGSPPTWAVPKCTVFRDNRSQPRAPVPLSSQLVLAMRGADIKPGTEVRPT